MTSFQWSCIWGGLLGICGIASAGEIEVVPSEVVLQGDFARAQLLVFDAEGSATDRRSKDMTRAVDYRSQDTGIVTVDERGQLLARSNGNTQIVVSN
ncbi:MAG: hypothetical protein ABGZ17_01225, partial [Planctomycetaceae bacterium]